MILLVFPNEREYNFTARWKLKNKVQKAIKSFHSEKESIILNVSSKETQTIQREP